MPVRLHGCVMGTFKSTPRGPTHHKMLEIGGGERSRVENIGYQELNLPPTLEDKGLPGNVVGLARACKKEAPGQRLAEQSP